MPGPLDYPALHPYLTSLIIRRGGGRNPVTNDTVKATVIVVDGVLVDPGSRGGRREDRQQQNFTDKRPTTVHVWAPSGTHANTNEPVEVVEKKDTAGNVIVPGGKYTLFARPTVTPLGVELELVSS